MMKFIINIASFILLSAPVAHSKIGVNEILEDGAVKEFLNSNDPKLEGFFILENSFKIYGAQFVIDHEPPTEWEVIDKSEGIDLIAAAEGTAILVGAMNGTIHIKNKSGVEKKYQISWTPLVQKTINNGCGKSAPRLFPADRSTGNNLLLATSCSVTDKNLVITVSTLAEIEWGPSSMFELAGKGNRWRQYQVPASTGKGGVIGEINFKIDGADKKFQLIAPKSDENVQKEKLVAQQIKLSNNFENEGFFSMTSLSYTADSVSGAESKYSLGYGFLSPKFYTNWRVGGSFESTFDIAKKDDAISFAEILLYSGYTYSVSEKWELSGNLAFQYANFQQKLTSVQMQNTQLGVLLNSNYFLNPKNRLGLNLYKTTFTSDVVKSNLAIALNYKYKLESVMNGIWIGGFYKTQSFQAVNTLGASREFKESSIGVSVAF